MNALLSMYLSTMRLRVTVTDENDAAVDNADVTLRIVSRTGVELAAADVIWPEAMSSNADGTYDWYYTDDVREALIRHQRYKAQVTVTAPGVGGTVTRYAELPIMVVVDED